MPKTTKTKTKSPLRVSSRPNRFAIAIASGLAAILGIVVVAIQASAPKTSYYVDCTTGANSNSGKDPASAWKTLSRASTATLLPGDQLLIKKNCVYTDDPLDIKASGQAKSPIFIGSYGSGPDPIIKRTTAGAGLHITGSYITVQSLTFDAAAPQKAAGKCSGSPVGNIQGIALAGQGAHHNIIRDITAAHLYAGIYIQADAHHNRVFGSTFTGNTMMSPLDPAGSNDAGAYGILVRGDNNDIYGNQFDDHDACSFDYGRDGSGVAIYGGKNNTVHHNRGKDNNTFFELTGSRTEGNTFAYNLYSAASAKYSAFLLTFGDGNARGPVKHTSAYNNTVYLPGQLQEGIVCHGSCGSSILTVKNNILWAESRALAAGGALLDESNNIYWKTGGNPTVQTMPSETSKKADPALAGPPANLHLKPSSPAINAGSDDAFKINRSYAKDLDGIAVTAGAVDIGAYEYH